MMTFTTIFICKSVKNSKYRPAMILGARIMSQAWLDKSIKEEKFASLSELKLPIFLGLKLAVIGYGGDDF